MYKISILSNFSLKLGQNMLLRQVSRVNFLALFWLISGLAGLIESSQIMAFNSCTGGRGLSYPRAGRLGLGAGGPSRASTGVEEDADMRDFSMLVSASRATTVFSAGKDTHPVAVADIVSSMSSLSVLGAKLRKKSDDYDDDDAEKESRSILQLRPQRDNPRTEMARRAELVRDEARATVVATGQAKALDEIVFPMAMDIVPEEAAVMPAVPAPVRVHTPMIIVRPMAIRRPPSSPERAVAIGVRMSDADYADL